MFFVRCWYMLTALKEHDTSSKHWSGLFNGLGWCLWLSSVFIGSSGSCYHSTDVLDKFCVNAVHPPPAVLSLKHSIHFLYTMFPGRKDSYPVDGSWSHRLQVSISTAGRSTVSVAWEVVLNMSHVTDISDYFIDLQEVHVSQWCVELWYRHVGSDVIRRTTLLGHEQPGRKKERNSNTATL